MRQSRRIVFLTFAIALAPSLFVVAGDSSAFDRLAAPYETVRQALLHDSMNGIVGAAVRIERELNALESNFSEAAAGVRAGAGDDLRPVLAEIRTGTAGLRNAAAVEEARESFGSLSEALLRYRQLVPEPGSAVAFCPMAQKVWLQPKGEIGNPYYGQSLARCGEIVSE